MKIEKKRRILIWNKKKFWFRTRSVCFELTSLHRTKHKKLRVAFLPFKRIYTATAYGILRIYTSGFFMWLFFFSFVGFWILRVVSCSSSCHFHFDFFAELSFGYLQRFVVWTCFSFSSYVHSIKKKKCHKRRILIKCAFMCVNDDFELSALYFGNEKRRTKIEFSFMRFPMVLLIQWINWRSPVDNLLRYVHNNS